jgi:hypothetical protein
VLGPELPARERSAAVVLRDGRIAVVGGRRKVAGEWQALDTLDLLESKDGDHQRQRRARTGAQLPTPSRASPTGGS